VTAPGGAGRRPRLALVLGGGAARGIAHVGVARVLEAEGIRPDLIVGTSAGALAGVFLAAGVSAARAEACAATLRWRRLVRPAVGRLGLASNDRIGQLLERALPVRRFEELATPFACVATDLETFEPVILREGELASAVRASCAVPGLVLPVARDGRLLVDGGVVQNVPVAAARQLGAELVVAVDVNPPARRGRPPSSLFGVAAQTVAALGRGSADGGAGHGPDLLIVPDVAHVGVDELHRARELVRAGAAAARAALPALRALLAGAEPGADTLREAA